MVVYAEQDRLSGNSTPWRPRGLSRTGGGASHVAGAALGFSFAQISKPTSSIPDRSWNAARAQTARPNLDEPSVF